jgi:ribosomal protein S18 acetylase RimI-like enzyme
VVSTLFAGGHSAIRAMERFVSSDNSTISTRPATADDVPAIAEIITQLLEGHQEGDAELYELSLHDPATADPETYFRDVLTSGDAKLIVGTVDGRVVGVVQCDVQRKSGTALWPGGTSIDVPWIGVHGEFRSRGVGSALMAAVDDVAQEVGAKQIRLRVWGFNDRAKAFYERVGFRAVRWEMLARPSNPT